LNSFHFIKQEKKKNTNQFIKDKNKIILFVFSFYLKGEEGTKDEKEKEISR
jgi:hypothetical protein